MLKEILILFVPGVTGVLFYRYLEKKRWSIWTYIENYLLFTFWIYFFGYTTFYLGGTHEFFIYTLGLKEQLKFGIMDIIYAVIMAAAIHFRGALGSKVKSLITVFTEKKSV